MEGCSSRFSFEGLLGEVGVEEGRRRGGEGEKECVSEAVSVEWMRLMCNGHIGLWVVEDLLTERVPS